MFEKIAFPVLIVNCQMFEKIAYRVNKIRQVLCNDVTNNNLENIFSAYPR